MQPQLYWQIHRLAFLFEKRADEKLQEQVGVRFAQFKVLEAIGRNVHTRQNVIAELLDQTEASISRQIKLLEKRRLIQVGVVVGNRRARELELTEEGEKVWMHAQQILSQVQATLIGDMDLQDQQLFHALFATAIENIQS